MKACQMLGNHSFSHFSDCRPELTEKWQEHRLRTPARPRQDAATAKELFSFNCFTLKTHTVRCITKWEKNKRKKKTKRRPAITIEAKIERSSSRCRCRREPRDRSVPGLGSAQAGRGWCSSEATIWWDNTQRQQAEPQMGNHNSTVSQSTWIHSYL